MPGPRLHDAHPLQCRHDRKKSKGEIPPSYRLNAEMADIKEYATWRRETTGT